MEELSKCVLDIADNLRRLADCLSASTKIDAGTEQVELSVEKPVETSTEVDAPAITLEEVRKILAEKSRDGKTAQVRELILKYGADILSAVDPEHFADLIKDAEVL